jgi:gliding motility-associated-like protein
MLCGVNETVLDATTQGVARYEWYGFDELANNFKVIPNEINPTLKITKSGRYKVIVYAKQTNQPDEDEIEVQFFREPVASKPKDIFICDPAQNTIDLTVNSNDILTGNTSEENYLVNYYESLQQLKAENPISNPKSYQIEETQEILAVVAGEESGCASDLVRFQVAVSYVPEVLLAEETVICIDLAGNITQQSELGRDLGSNYSYISSAEGNSISTAPIFNFSQVPNFDQLKLQVTDTRSGCSVEFQTKILVYSKARTVLVKIEGSDFTGGTTVTADAENGTGENTTYEYRADTGSWQESARFNKLNPGYHTISAREINGCGITVSPKFYLVGYQRFFTPNSDGYNDTWNITGNNEIKILKLYVFDRYGKLLKEIIPGGGAWDGTYNGRNLPTNDYWFKVTYEMNGGKRGSFSANFTLKR